MENDVAQISLWISLKRNVNCSPIRVEQNKTSNILDISRICSKPSHAERLSFQPFFFLPPFVLLVKRIV